MNDVDGNGKESHFRRDVECCEHLPSSILEGNQSVKFHRWNFPHQIGASRLDEDPRMCNITAQGDKEDGYEG